VLQGSHLGLGALQPSRKVSLVSAFTSVSVDRFRGLRGAVLEDLRRLNLVTGLNGCGKTALLESIFMLSAPDRPELSVAVMNFRGIERFSLAEVDTAQTPWDSMFTYDNEEREVRLSAVMDSGLAIGVEAVPQDAAKQRQASGGKRVSLPSAQSAPDPARTRGIRWVSRRGNRSTTRSVYVDTASKELVIDPPSRGITFQAAMRLPATRVDQVEMAERFGRMEVDGATEILVEALRLFDSRVRAVRTIFNRTGPFLHVDIGGRRLLPITLMGGGFVALAQIVIDMHECSSGVLLLDEVESGFHYSLMPSVWEVIASAASHFETQVIATTHSLEFIQSARSLMRTTPEEFRLYRLERAGEGGRSRVVEYDATDVASALDLGLDVR